ncbi:23S rRNA (uracil(1939)-C(5))-methyltransferase RlmD [Pseudoflavonifractor phocaeensis]|uniref:23S rRNA (uracil(1939)-C(5))-methyltransferase RlmD n=1 Tax=Pseudoflavonifractor phocaeensis TaxID=1870988 RepID=UPI0025A35ED5|nr:23S rRNA (uracil(1939)-C(5))-methyltransferase RlmD [Pseudoflavonifractor phocaeensis]MDM8238394.1 23S rRNA (uracil(1939)-C(5))-methyltransferase RlmD [Pseudoflavonifractor phocaeensis]
MADWKKNSLHDLHIDSYTAQGFGLARLEGRVVFIPGTIRGEDWTVQLLKVQKNIAWGRGVKLLTPSPARVEPDCPISGKCGGCQYRHMTYEEELSAKWDRVNDALRRLGGLDLELPPVLGAEDPLRYRNKVQLPVAQGKNGLSIGYFRPRSHDVLDVEDCPLQPLAVTRLREAFKAWMEQWSVPAYDEGTCQGLIRHLYVRTNQAGQSLCCVVANGKKLPQVPELVDALRAAEPGLIGLVLNVNQADTNVILGPEYRTLWGQDFLEETLCGMTFRLSVPSFFQINWAQTQRLYAQAVDFAALTGQETVLDLYCGIGTISLALAQKAGQVIGAEIVPQAIEDAKANAERNKVENTRFFCGDAGAVAAQLAQEGVRPQVICVDPPRKGLAPEVPAILASMAPERIVYVSCDPATLARDAKRLEELGYRAVKVQAVDLFPRTAHVETVVLLGRKFEKSRDHVYLDYEPSAEIDLPGGATYSEIKQWIQAEYDLKVSSLYVAQVKQKHGIVERECYNKPKSENAKQPKCPPEKEAAIEAALKHFKMI